MTQMNDVKTSEMSEIVASLLNAQSQVEEELGFSIPVEIITEVLVYTVRKCRIIGKTESYLPLLFKTELKDYFTRLEINMRGVRCNVQPMFAVPV